MAVRPQWWLLQQHLEATGPGWYSMAEREERLLNSQDPVQGLATMCKQEHPRLASSFSFCLLTHLADFQETVPI